MPSVCDGFGADRYMWTSDYPHADSTWPQSRRIIAETLGELPDPIVTKLIGGNASRLYL